MAEKKLTNTAIKNLPTPAKGRTEYPDHLVPGLKLRVTDKGAKSWTFRFRANGTQRRMTLGAYPIIGLSDAREIARGHLMKVEAGSDPIEEQKRAQVALDLAEREAVILSAETVIDDFVERHCRVKNRNTDESVRVFEKDIKPQWTGRDIRSITRLDVNLILDQIVDRGAPVQANRTLSQLHKFLAWCLSRGYIELNPATGIEKPGQETKRDRVLSDDELKAIWQACGKLPVPFGDYVRMLMLTAARRSEIARLERDEIQASDFLLAIPKEKTKSKRDYEIAAGPMAQSILGNLPAYSGRYVFSTTNGRRPISGFSKAKAELDELSGVTVWTYHDLRRTVSTRLNEMGVLPHIVSALLNHTIKGIETHYNLATYRPEKIAAINRWEAHVQRVITGAADKVVALRP